MQTLHQVVEDGSFWLLPDRDVLQLIKSEFPQELERLKNATFVRSSNAPRPPGPSIAELLYGQDYPEINRTLVGVLALRWLHNDDYDRFIGSQGPPPIVLKRESFAWLRSLFDKGLQSTEDTYTLIVSMVTNDLGKDPALADDYAKKVGIDISKVNHDMILYHAVEEGMVPALDRLTKQARDYLLLGIKLGSDFNFGQLAQAENAPASLSGLLDMRGHDRAFEMRFMEQVLDLAGAAGHEDWTCAKKMIEPIFQSYRNVYDVAHGIIYEGMPLREGYDIILRRKLALLHWGGYSRHFDITRPEDRALMRLFCLGNTTDADNADIFYTAFTQRIPSETRSQLTHGLNVDGSVDEPAVQPTYLPAMLTKAVGNTATGSQEDKIAAVAALLRFLGRCFVVEPETLQSLPRGVTVIERDVRKLIPVLESDEFKRNPDVLDKESIPEGQVANMAPGLEAMRWERERMM
ncbi:hypothetical protein A1O7_06371 [Cladophialophora yegresii CBS 114405]|uniref:Uncharacterized protein n=1 Tax=Cladophialophora yegresii CBS 114405 TaxID=1182544 RepID=W9W1T1_9EURO|nr:uncharacterized protein A1O7_06371 [Cladophialophora yegresii CBS 114405]EXJ58940.1 hypothetical protein A1O7_06371 [Cladophialophora yegresii CBS 114405]